MTLTTLVIARLWFRLYLRKELSGDFVYYDLLSWYFGWTHV